MSLAAEITPAPSTASVSPYAVRGGLKAGQRRIGMLLLLPAATAFGLVILYPFLQALALSLFEYTLETPAPRFTGLANFAKIAATPDVWQAFATTAIYVFFTTTGTLNLGLGWALNLNQPFRGRGLTGPLIKACVDYARVQGAAAVEAYPVDTERSQADVFVFTGLASTFRRAGFVEVARRSPTRPIMRYVFQGAPTRNSPRRTRRSPES